MTHHPVHASSLCEILSFQTSFIPQGRGRDRGCVEPCLYVLPSWKLVSLDKPTHPPLQSVPLLLLPPRHSPPVSYCSYNSSSSKSPTHTHTIGMDTAYRAHMNKDNWTRNLFNVNKHHLNQTHRGQATQQRVWERSETEVKQGKGGKI